MNGPSPEMVELFLQEASEHLQFLREYSGILQDPYPLYEDIERLYISAHGVSGTGGTYGYSLFHEVASKLAHIFQYAMNASISPQAAAPLVEFIYEAIAVLESDLIMVSAKGEEAVDDIAAFKQRFPFAFQGPPPPSATDPVEQPHPPEPEMAAPEPPPPAVQAPQPAAQAVAPVEPPPPAEPIAEPVAEPVAELAETEPVQATEIAPPVDVVPLINTAPSTDVVPLMEIVPPVEFEAPANVAPPVDVVPPVDVEEPFDAVSPVDIAPVEEVPPVSVEAPLDVMPPFDTPVEPVVELAVEPVVQSAAVELPAPVEPVAAEETRSAITAADVPDLQPDENLPDEVLEFFIPEVEEHLQTVTHCLLALEASANPEDIHRLFRAMHTIKGSAAQVGAQRIATIAHRAEDLVGRLRDGELKPSAAIVDLCLDTVDILKRTIYRQWPDDKSFQRAARTLIARLQSAASEEAATTVIPSVAERAEAPAITETVAQLQPPIAPPMAIASVAVAQPVIEQQPAIAPQVAPPAQVSPAPQVALPSQVSPAAASVAPMQPVAAPAQPITVPAATVDEQQSEAGPPTAEEEIAAAFATLEEPRKGAPELAEAQEQELSEAALAQRTPVGMAQSKSVRIGLERLDRMMNAVGELVINRTRMLGRLVELEKLAEVLNFSKGRMSDKVAEFQEKYEFSRIGSTTLPPAQWQNAESNGFNGQGQFFGGAPAFGAPAFGSSFSSYGSGGSSYGSGGTEFSELEMDRYDDFGILSRSLTEISADITEVLSQLDGFVRRVDGDIDEFTKLAHRLQDEITQARMVPIGNLYTRIARTVRDAAKASNKQVELTLAGAETELDNNIIQHLADPLLHLVRNSVAHGIEHEDERYEAGKPDQGNVAVRAYHKGNHIYVEVEDDGRGVDFDRVKQTAIASGVITEEQAVTLGQRELVALLFRPGFSTAERRTELAGRGVGLDVVRSNVTSLNGEIEVETEKGIGTRFTLKVPLTLIISQALFVQCGEQTFAFPLAFVEEIRRIRPNEIEEVGGKLITKVRDVLTEVVRFDEALQLAPLQPVNGFLRLVLVNVGGRQVGIVVEEVLRKDEIVIKNLGEYLHNVKMFPGATIAPDGSLILMVDVNRLIMGESIERRPLASLQNAARLFLPGASAVARGEIPAAAVDRVEREKLVVLADDSISVRKFVGRMLEKAGYRVKLASDGLEALEIATSTPCDLVITDLEMPRTNGYELMMHLRQTASTAKVPVMVVTSRAGAKHREHALKEGASAFMVKPVQEETFIAQVVELIGSSGQAMPASPVVH